MRRKNTTSEMMRGYIAEALLILMENQSYDRITIGEITAKAGVNRSTYYRNFRAKEEILQFYFLKIIVEYLKSADVEKMDLRAYLTGMFTHFQRYRKQLLCMDRSGVSHYILDALNRAFVLKTDSAFFDERLSVYYHTGGIFNTFQLWFSDGMRETPEQVTNAVLRTLPGDFVPMLLRKNECSGG